MVGRAAYLLHSACRATPDSAPIDVPGETRPPACHVANMDGRILYEMEPDAYELDAKTVICVLALPQRLIEATDAIVQFLFHSHAAAAGMEQKWRVIRSALFPGHSSESPPAKAD